MSALLVNKDRASFNLISLPIPGTPKDYSHVPQHPLLTKHQWNRLQKGEIKQFTYWVTTGNYKYATHHHSIVVTKKDVP